MRQIFLGKPYHWGLLVVTAVVLWAVGTFHLHTSQFNLFAGITFLAGTVIVLAVVLPHRPGERITREPIEFHDDGP